MKAVRSSLQTIRGRIDAKRYACAPDFWEDLRGTLSAVEAARQQMSAKGKVQHVLKQIARLEVRFWAKESVGMLKDSIILNNP